MSDRSREDRARRAERDRRDEKAKPLKEVRRDKELTRIAIRTRERQPQRERHDRGGR